jgi:hypothetical protein
LAKRFDRNGYLHFLGIVIPDPDRGSMRALDLAQIPASHLKRGILKTSMDPRIREDDDKRDRWINFQA